MLGSISFGNKQNFEQFKKQIPISVLPLFEEMREFCFSLGDNIIEDIRMHRIVFGKSMTFRWFADIAPQENIIVIKIQKSRKEAPKEMKIGLNQDISELKKILDEAYKCIK